jgi:hypothetical protein
MLMSCGFLLRIWTFAPSCEPIAQEVEFLPVLSIPHVLQSEIKHNIPEHIEWHKSKQRQGLRNDIKLEDKRSQLATPHVNSTHELRGQLLLHSETNPRLIYKHSSSTPISAQQPDGSAVLPVLVVEEYFAPEPRPLFAKPFQIRHLFAPPVRAVSASKIASRAWTKLGLHGCLRGRVLAHVRVKGEKRDRPTAPCRQ